MQQIKAPDGSIVQFPDGTDDATIISVMKKNFGQSSAPAAPQGPSFMQSALGLAQNLSPVGQLKTVGNAILHPQQALQQADDSVRALANGATFGYADKLAAGANQLTGLNSGDTVTNERALSDAARARNPAGYMAAETAGSLLPVTKAASLGITATRLPGMAGRLLGLPLDGAAIGGLQAAGNDQNVTQGALTGAALGVGQTALNSALGGIINRSAAADMRANAPSFEQNKAAKNALYGQLQDAGIKFDANGFQQTLGDIADSIKNYRPAKAPLTADTLDNIAQFNGKSPTFNDLEGMLQDAKSILREPNASNTDKSAANIVVDKLQGFFDNGALSTNGSIPADQVASMAAQARDLARRDIIAKQFGKMGDKADWYVSGPESGLRNQVASFGKRQGNSLSPAEYDAAQAVVKREGLDNILSQAGTRIAMHGGTAGAGVIGGMLGGPMGALAGSGAALLGNMAARKISAAATQRSMDRFLQTVLAGRQAQQQAAQNATMRIQNIPAAVKMGLLGLTPMMALQNGQ